MLVSHPTQRRCPSPCRALLALLSLALVAPVSASELDATRAELQEIRQSIDQAQQRLERTQGQQSEASTQLESAEKALADTHTRLAELDAERQSLNDALVKLDTRRDALEKEFAAQREALAEQVRALYKLGEQPRLKLLLDPEDPGEIDRLQYYLNRLNEARAQQIARLERLEHALEDNRRDIEERSERLDEVVAEVEKRRERLAALQSERESALAELGARLERDQSQLAGLEDDRQDAEAMVSRLEQALARARAEREARERREREARERELAAARERKEEARRQEEARAEQSELSEEELRADTDAGTPVPVRQGDGEDAEPAVTTASAAPATAHPAAASAQNSRWPVQGRVVSAYGEGEGLNRNGVVIAAASGTPIHAVEAGQVVFADWMRGFGYLIILDHDGVLSLYAHQQRLTVDSGDRVARGAVLGFVGDTGGLSRPALYFEMRRNGETINPDGWLAAR